MPNHVYSRLKLSGDALQIEKVIAGSKAYDEREQRDYLDFSKLFPTPKELVAVSSGGGGRLINGRKSGANIVSEEKYQELLAQGEPDCGTGRPITQQMAEDYLDRFGFDNWYDWNNANWGTKWGTYSVEADPEKENEFTFQTAWSPARGLWTNISKQFPDVVFATEAVDEGGGFVITETYQNGEITESLNFDHDSDEGIAIRQSVGYYYDDEDEDEDDDFDDDNEGEDIDVEALFNQFEDDFLQFEKVEPKRSNRPDLHAFLLLDSLFPGDCDMVSAAEHDEIYLEIDPEELAKKATPEQIQELVRCGVRYDNSSLAMFV